MGFGVTESTLRKKSIIGNRVATVNAAARLHPCFLFFTGVSPLWIFGAGRWAVEERRGDRNWGSREFLGRYILRSSTCHSWWKFVLRPSSFHRIGNFISWHVSSRTDNRASYFNPLKPRPLNGYFKILRYMLYLVNLKRKISIFFI